jgi:hypothetical protein
MSGSEPWGRSTVLILHVQPTSSTGCLAEDRAEPSRSSRLRLSPARTGSARPRLQEFFRSRWRTAASGGEGAAWNIPSVAGFRICRGLAGRNPRRPVATRAGLSRPEKDPVFRNFRARNPSKGSIRRNRTPATSGKGPEGGRDPRVSGRRFAGGHKSARLSVSQ